jgi:hypothetical protein
VSHLEDLPLQERIHLYREHASRMMRMARVCASEPMRIAYLRLAAQWQSLVLELEQSNARRSEALGPESLSQESLSAAFRED